MERNIMVYIETVDNSPVVVSLEAIALAKKLSKENNKKVISNYDSTNLFLNTPLVHNSIYNRMKHQKQNIHNSSWTLLITTFKISVGIQRAKNPSIDPGLRSNIHLTLYLS